VPPESPLPTPTTRGTRLDAETRRTQILDVALQCFAANGFRGTTTREVAAAVGITEAALYRYYPSKEALYSEIVARKTREPELLESLRAAAEARDDAAVFGGLARAIFARGESDPAFLRILFFTALEGHALAEPFFASRVRRLREFLTAYIEQRMRDGALRRMDPVLAARAFLGMVFDQLITCVVFDQRRAYPQPVEEVVATFVSIFLAGMRAETEHEHRSDR